MEQEKGERVGRSYAPRENEETLMIISNPDERKKQRENKILSVMKFLNEFTYSDFNTLKLMFGYKSHRVLYSLLNFLEREGLITKKTINGDIKKKSIWMIRDIDLNKIKSSTVERNILVQRVAIVLRRKGMILTRGDDAQFTEKNQNVSSAPDWVIKSPEGLVFSIIIHEKIKTPVRYNQIITDHMEHIANRKWDYTVILTRDVQSSLLVALHIKQLNHFSGRYRGVLIKNEHRKKFHITSLDIIDDFNPESWV